MKESSKSHSSRLAAVHFEDEQDDTAHTKRSSRVFEVGLDHEQPSASGRKEWEVPVPEWVAVPQRSGYKNSNSIVKNLI